MVPTVLVVEPYADLRSGIVSTLKRISLDCDAVATPEAAQAKLQDHDYAWVVVDVDSPDPTTELVSSINTRSHVILITDADPRERRQTPRHATLRKPFGRDELLAQFPK